MTDFRRIYALLDTVSPLDGDCGALCGAACCKLDPNDELGMYLLPGEEQVHDQNDPWLSWSVDDPAEYELPESWTGKLYFVCCHGAEHCKRSLRPVQCRTFPLAPYITEDGHLCLIVDNAELPYVCPLVEDYRSINHDFVSVTFQAWKMLIADNRIYDMVYDDSRFRDSCEAEYIFAYME